MRRWRPVKMGPELAEREAARAGPQALDDGENVKAKVTVTAKDAAGNVATAKRTITLVKCGALRRIVRRRNDPVAEAIGLNGRAASAALLVTGCGM